MTLLLSRFRTTTAKIAAGTGIAAATALAAYHGLPAAAVLASGAGLKALLDKLLGGLGETLAGKAGEAAWKQCVQRLSSPATVLRNEDLTRLVGRSLHAILDACAQTVEPLDADAAKRYRTLGKLLERDWSAVSQSPAVARLDPATFAPLAEAELPSLFDPMSGPTFPPVLKAADWEPVLLEFGQRAKLTLSQTDVKTVSSQVSQKLAFAVYEHLKEDLERGGRAFGGYVIHALGRLQATTAQTAATVDDTHVRVLAIASYLAATADDERKRFSRLLVQVSLLQDGVDALQQGQGALQQELAALPDRCTEALTSALGGTELADTFVRAVAGKLELTLPRLQLRLQKKGRRTDESIASRFSAHQRRIEFLAREDELATLEAWMRPDDARPLTIAAITGPAGVGKTRLAMELCDRARDVGWHAGFLDRAGLASLVDQARQRTWAWDLPTLIVVDYAAEEREPLDALLSHLESWEELVGRPPLRLLLVERHGAGEAPWWDALMNTDRRKHWNDKGGYRVQLNGLGEGATRTALVHAALRASAPPDRPAAEPPPADVQRALRLVARLDTAGTARSRPTPLVIQLVCDLLDVLPQDRALQRDDVLQAWRDREGGKRLLPLLRRPGAHGGTDRRDAYDRAIAAITLAQGALTEDAITALPRPASVTSAPADPDAALNVLKDFCGHTDGRFRSLEPDLLAEFWVQASLLSLPEEKIWPVLHHVVRHGGEECVVFLVRLLQDFPACTSAARLLQRMAALADLPSNALARAVDSLPEHSVAHRTLCVDLSTALCTRRQAERDGVPARDAECARTLNNLANRLAEVGRRDDALKAIEEATGLYRRLATAHPDAFVPDLAMSLNNLANQLAEVGRRDDALKAIEEAVVLRRRLATAHPDAFVPDLAGSLNNLANRLAAVGRRDDALEAIEEATGLYRRLATAHPDAFVPDLAMSLNNLANRLAEVGRRDDALKAIEEAVVLRRRLATAQPDAFVPNLAASLNNLANHLAEIGRRDDALKAIEEAVVLRRRLATAQPDAFVPNLAASLNNLANHLAEIGRRDDALKAIEEATGLYRRLATAHPDAFVPNFAASLNNLAIRLAEVGRHDDALKAIEEAVVLRRRLATAQPDAFLPNLAASLNNLANQLAEVGRRDDALKAIEEAVGLRRRLATAHPEAFVPNLAASLNNLANRLAAVGRRDDALKAIEEATGLYRRLATAHPDAFVPDLAMSLNNLANQLAEVGRRDDALKAIEEATGLYRRLATAHPDAFVPDLAMSLNNLANQLAEVGRRDDALKAIEEAVVLRRRLATAHPDAFVPDLAASLNNLANQLAEVGRRDDALRAIEEAVELWRASRSRVPAAFDRNFAISCLVRGDLLLDAAGAPEATATTTEGLAALLDSPAFHPAADGDLARALGELHARTAADAGLAPDAGLLDRLAKVCPPA